MGWFVLGVVCSALLGAGFALMFVGGDADDRAVDAYRRQRDEFERWFK